MTNFPYSGGFTSKLYSHFFSQKARIPGFIGGLLLAWAATTAAHSASFGESFTNPTPFVLFEYGLTEVDSGDLSVRGGAKSDKKDSGWRLGGGVKFDNGVFAEGFYADLGKLSFTGGAGGTFRSRAGTLPFTAGTVDIEAKTLGLGIGYELALTEGLYLNLVAGGHRWDISASTTVSGVTVTGSDGTDIYGGIGLRKTLTDNISIIGGARSYEIDTNTNTSGGGDVTMMSLGLQFSLSP
ncbi:MAG: outer membrane beta-barrel protein [Pseudomonadota bacterium]